MGRQPAPDDDCVQHSAKQNEAVRTDARDAVDVLTCFRIEGPHTEIAGLRSLILDGGDDTNVNIIAAIG